MDFKIITSCYTFLFSILYLLQTQARAEETPFSYENSRVVKMFAMRGSKTSTPQPVEISDKFNMSTGLTGMRDFLTMLNEVETLKRTVAHMKHMVFLSEIAEKCVASIKRRNEFKAQRHWDQILQSLHSNQEETSNILRRITVEAYDGNRDNILPVVHFVNYTKDFSGLGVLLEEMREYGHLYGGTEIFLFARLIRTRCGTHSDLYEELPVGIQYVDSYTVHLINENNNGALFYKSKSACRGRYCIADEAYTYQLGIEDSPEEERLRGTWRFEPTNTTEYTDNIKFNLRNEFGNKSYLYSTYYTSLSETQKSSLMVHLVNNTEDAIRIRVEESHLVKRLIMGRPQTGSNTIQLSIMYTEDRFDKANDGNWVIQKLDNYRSDEWDETNIDTSFKCQFNHGYEEKA